MLHKESIEFQWNYPEFEFKEKTKMWYLGVAIVSLIFIAIALLMKNYLFAFLILLGGFMMFTIATKEPMVVSAEVSKHGIKIHSEMHPYQDIFAFWIGESITQKPILIIKTKKKITPIIAIPLPPEINIMQLREFLLEFIEEEEIHEPFTDKLIEHIGF